MSERADPGLVATLGTMRREILPLVARELEHWQAVAGALPDARARRVALDSLGAKRFHCEGGSVLALAAPPGRRETVVRAIVAVQTLSDFLDSWTDRPAPGATPGAARILACHTAFVRAASGLGGSAGADERRALGAAASAYADALVAEARRALGALPAVARARPRLLRIAFAYAAMQSMKHAAPEARVDALGAWHRRRRLGERRSAALRWPEFGAAAGSTLGLFRLYAWAAGELRTERPAALDRAYRPDLCALHILLDALVDGAEDARSGDLNWIAELGGERAATARLGRLAARARARLAGDSIGAFVLDGLFAMYLSDPKARALGARTRLRLWRAAGPRALVLGVVVRRWGSTGVLGPRPAQMAADGEASPARASTARVRA